MGILFFPSAGRDDSYITYWPAYTLAHQGEMVNYNGERVEQSSSLLQVIVLAAIGFVLPASMVNIGMILSILCAVATLIAVYRLTARIRPPAAFLATLLTAGSVYFIYWTFGGQETTMVTCTALFLLITFGDFLSRHSTGNGTQKKTIPWQPALAILLFIMVRPETQVVTICMIAGMLILSIVESLFKSQPPVPIGANQKSLDRRGEVVTSAKRTGGTLAPVGMLSLISVAAIALLFLFRYIYYGGLFPQPVSAKAGGISKETLIKGILYLKTHLLGNIYTGLLTFLAVVAVGYWIYRQFKEKNTNYYIRFTLLFLAAYTFFVLLVGGDWMEGGRFLVPMIPVVAMLIALFLMDTVKTRFIKTLFIGFVLLLQLLTILHFAGTQSTSIPIWQTEEYFSPLAQTYKLSRYSRIEKYNRVHIRDIPMIHHLGKIVERLLSYKKENNDTGKIVVMSGQGGMVTYYLARKYYKQFYFIDRMGLIDRTFSRCSAVRNANHSTDGLGIYYSDFFDQKEGIRALCNIPLPDIIYDLQSADAREVVENGYTLLYWQGGEVITGSRFFHGGTVRFDQFIAVRNDLLVAFEGYRQIRLRFDELHR